MVYQADVKTNGKAQPDTDARVDVTASVTGLAHDAIELAELQVRLLKLDVRSAARNGQRGLALGVGGVCLLLGCVPVALLALAEVFVAQFGWSQAAALGAAAAIGLAASAVAAAAAWQRMRAGLSSLERSRDELNRNIAWIKSQLNRDKSSGLGSAKGKH
jgi:hypothetical protein